MKAQQSIRTQVGVILLIILVSAFSASAYYINIVIAERFTRLEDRETATNIERVAEVISDGIGALGIRIGDWAYWDDSFNYMQAKGEFETSNLTPEGLDTMAIDGIRYYTLDFKLYGASDRVKKDDGSLDYTASFDTLVEKYREVFADVKSSEIKTGLVELRGQHFFFASSPIKPSSGEGEAAGHILFLKHLDQTFTEKVSALTKLTVTHQLVGASPLIRSTDVDLKKIKAISHASFEKVSKDKIQSEVYVFDSNDQVALRFSFALQRELMAQGAKTLQTVITSFVAVSIFTILLLGLALDHAVVRRILRLTREVQEVGQAGGNSQRVTVNGENELATLAMKINSMLGTIEDKQKAIKDIVSNAKSGFLIAGADGRIREGFTSFCASLLKNNDLEGALLSEILFNNQHDRHNWDAFFEQVMENMMPEDITLSMLPSKILYQEHTWLSIAGAGIYDRDQQLIAVLFTLNDVTQLERVERQNRENMALLKILRSLDNFLGFKEGTRTALQNAMAHKYLAAEQDQLRRLLHTLKGNFSVFLMSEIAGKIHEIESHAEITHADLDLISSEFRQFLSRNREVLEIDYDLPNQKNVVIARQQVNALAKAAPHWRDTGEAIAAITAFVVSATHTPFAMATAGLVDEANRLAKRLGKQVDVAIVGGDTLVDVELLRPVVENLVHAIRNALDHGIEAPSARIAAGKTQRGRLEITAGRDSNGMLTITLNDDGKGLSRNEILASVQQHGGSTFAHINDATPLKELFAIVFQDGFSTRSEVTQFSGRGMGMSALKQAVEEMHGRIEFNSQAGKGSMLTIEIRDDMTKESLLTAA